MSAPATSSVAAEKPTAPRPRGRPRRPPEQQTRLVAVRLTAAQIAVAAARGQGDVSAGIRAALAEPITAPPVRPRRRTA